MVAIQTKYMGPTNSRGSRIKAFTENGQQVTISYDYALSGEKLHAKAAMALIEKAGWQNEYKKFGLVCGGTKNGYVFVFNHEYARV
jgi:hypothetical protein